MAVDTLQHTCGHLYLTSQLLYYVLNIHSAMNFVFTRRVTQYSVVEDLNMSWMSHNACNIEDRKFRDTFYLPRYYMHSDTDL